MKRRSFIKAIGVASGSALCNRKLIAEETTEDKEQYALLIDTTRCIGCRTCEESCATANNLPAPDISDESALQHPRKTTESQWTVINRYQTDSKETFVKTQCMHCIEPACTAACLTKAMYKTNDGAVIWREDKCMGCRFCMISCPYDIPKFEYQGWNPKIQKCVMCWNRISKGGKPSCVENCPSEALMFGKRRELLEEARKRIYTEPDNYVHHIYGEHEAGGSSVLYLSSVPFAQIGFTKEVGNTSYPALTTGFLYSVPVVLILWPALLLALNNANKKETSYEV